MKIRRLEEEKLIAKKDVCIEYAEKGCVLFYYEKERDKLLHIVAEADYIENGNDKYYHISKGKYADLADMKVGELSPCPKTNIKLPFTYIMRDSFFDSHPFVHNVIQSDYDRYKQYYRIKPKEMRVIFFADHYLETACYYGSTIDPDFAVDAFQKQVEQRIEVITYEEYLARYEISVCINKESAKIPPVPEVIQEIKKWVQNTTYGEFEQAISERVIGQPELQTVLASVYNYLEAKANGRNSKFNVVIAAPSGSGKTETFRAMRDYFKDRIPGFPLSQIDLTQITEEGFIGKNTNAIVSDLLQKEGTDGIGIVWLDEFDKKVMPSYTSKGDNVNQNVQNQILTLVEGRVVEEKEKKINTENTLFIACGAFNECRKEKGVITKHVGFERTTEYGSDHYTTITKQDMIELGASYELLGRFPLLVNFQKLSEEAVDLVIDKSLKNLRKDLGIYVNVAHEYRKKLHMQANTEYGCRQLVASLTETVMPAFVLALKKGKLNNYKIWVDEEGRAEVLPNVFTPGHRRCDDL